MRQRATALGFEPASRDEITYVTVPGYTPRLAVDFSVPGQVKKQNVLILPEYTESLFDWITRKLAQSVTELGSP